MINSKRLLKIAEILRDKQLADKLYNCKNKNTAINFIYKQVEHLIKGFFRDTDWKNVMNVFNAIKALGVDLEWGVKNGGYNEVKDNNGNITSKYKQYDLIIKFTNIDNKEFIIKGHLIATDASDNDQFDFDRYDISLILN
jgi:hypothetical protein